MNTHGSYEKGAVKPEKEVRTMKGAMKILLFASAILAMGLVMQAQAAPVSLPNGPVYFQFNNLEQFGGGNQIVVPGGGIDVNGDGIVDTPATEGNWGVFNVSSIQYGGIATNHQDISGGSAFFADDGVSPDIFGMGQVSGIFYGITVTSATTAAGGWMDIYWEDPATDDITNADLNGGFGPGNRTAANQAGKFTDGTLLVRLQFASGIIPGDAVTTISSNVDPSTLTGTGRADSFANVMDINGDGVIDAADGAWAAYLNQDWFWVDDDGDGIYGELGETRDVRFSNFFNLLASWNGPNGIIGLRSNDPGRAYSQIPEPSTLLLLGAGLLGLGVFARRRQR
jgi:hypothetical protein